MEFNKESIKGKWNEIKGEVQKVWGKLTDDELEQTKGDLKAVGGLLQQKYGKTAADYESDLNDIVGRLHNKKESVVETIKQKLKK